MNKLTTDKRVEVVKMLTEGMGINATCRVTGVAKNTVLKLLVELGEACELFHDKTVRNVRARRIEADEIWAFCHSKAKNVPADKQGVFGYGDVWTWKGIDVDTKLLVSWYVGTRDAGAAHVFIADLASRLASRVQLTTDGLKSYLSAVEDAFGDDIDYAQLVKQYGNGAPGDAPANIRYSPAVCTSITKTPITGTPDMDLVSTSYIERSNLTLRMHSRRFTRLTNGHSKKLMNHCAALALHFVVYNFAKIHSTLRVTPAMEAGLSDHVWEIAEVVALMDWADLYSVDSAAGSN